MHYCNISISLKNEDGSCPPQCLDYYKLICWLSQTGFMDYGLKLSFVVLGFPQFQSSFSEAVGNSNKQSYASSIRQKQKTPTCHMPHGSQMHFISKADTITFSNHYTQLSWRIFTLIQLTPQTLIPNQSILITS